MTTATDQRTGEVSYLEAISQALDEEMTRDERVFLMAKISVRTAEPLRSPKAFSRNTANGGFWIRRWPSPASWEPLSEPR